MKILLITACIGHIICGITDCMLAYMKNGNLPVFPNSTASKASE